MTRQQRRRRRVLFGLVMTILLVELIHQLGTLQHLMDLQDSSSRLEDRLMEEYPIRSKQQQSQDEKEPAESPYITSTVSAAAAAAATSGAEKQHESIDTTQQRDPQQPKARNGGVGRGPDTINDDSTKRMRMRMRMEDVCRIPPSEGPEGSMGFQALTKIRIYKDHDQHSSSSVPFLKIRLLCIVVTDSTHHATTLPAILETYGSRCDGFVAFSNATDASVHAVEILAGNDDDDDDDEWDRLQQIWKHVQHEYGSSFDAFHFGVESTVVIPSNLRRLLATTYPQHFVTSSDPHPGATTNGSITITATPVYLGGAVVAARKDPQLRHCGGKAGYTLNRAALQLASRLSECSVSTIPKEEDHTSTTTTTSNSLPVDQRLARCLEQIDASLKCVKTVNDDSALRYIEFGLDYQARFTTKTKKYVKRTPVKVKPLADHHGIYIRDGLQGIAEDAVAFSAVNYRSKRNHTENEQGLFTVADAIRRVDAILKRTCRPLWDDPPIVALDVDGTTPGYRHDPTYLRRHPPNMTDWSKGDDTSVCQLPFGSGREGPAGYQGLNKIRIRNKETKPVKKKKVLCMIYTQSRRHYTRLRPIAETYGPHCDGFLAASNKTDPSIGAVHLLHEGPEAYENMWLKVRSIWKYAYQHYLNDYDLFHIGGDDHYLIPENLVYMAEVGSWKGPWKNDSEPLFLGGSMIDFPMTTIRYCGGGSGYTLNRAALKLLIEDLFDTYHCRPHYQASDEDRIISDCFRSAGISCMDTNDSRNETRYHQASVDFHASWTRDQPAVWHAGPLDRVHGIASKERLGQISESSVSFHLKGMPKGVQDRGMRRYHAILYGLCNGTTLIAEQIHHLSQQDEAQSQ